MRSLVSALLAATLSAAHAGGFTRICNSGEAAGSGGCPAQPPLGNAANDWACTRDDASGLVWELKTADDGPRDRERTYTNFSADYDPSRTRGSGADAAGYVAMVNARGLCGARDWRPPTRLELLGLMRHGAKVPVDAAFFPNTASKAAKSVYWSGSGFAGNRASAWGIDFGDGVAGDDNRSVYYALRLVRGAVAPPERVVSADGREVHDRRAGLAWRRCAEGSAWDGSRCAGDPALLDADAAERRARDEAQASGLAWRLPTIAELMALVDDGRVAPALDPLLPAAPQGLLWSSTASAADPAYRWALQLADGHVGNHAYRHDRHALRLVRSQR